MVTKQSIKNFFKLQLKKKRKLFYGIYTHIIISIEEKERGKIIYSKRPKETLRYTVSANLRSRVPMTLMPTSGASGRRSFGYKRVRIQYRKLLPHHAQSFTRNLVLPRYRGYFSLSSSSTYTSSLFLSLFLSFNLQLLPVQEAEPLFLAAARARSLNEHGNDGIEDGRRKRESPTHARENH